MSPPGERVELPYKREILLLPDELVPTDQDERNEFFDDLFRAYAERDEAKGPLIITGARASLRGVRWVPDESPYSIAASLITGGLVGFVLGVLVMKL